MVDFCPHCGEPLEPEARVCPYCGSDEETGWKVDAEVESVELPEDEEDDDASATVSQPPAARPAAPADTGRLLVVLSVLAFLAAGFSAYSWAVLVPLAFLGACALLFAAGSRPTSSLTGTDRGQEGSRGGRD